MKRSFLVTVIFFLAFSLMQLPGQGAEAEKKSDGKKRPATASEKKDSDGKKGPGLIKTDSVAEEDHPKK